MIDNMLLSVILFSISIVLVITGIIDRLTAVFIGIILMIIMGVMSPLEAFSAIDWNVLAILLGMWIITEYMVAAGIPDYLVYLIGKKAKNYNQFILLLGLFSGFLSIFVDNVLVILLLGTIIVRAAIKYDKNPIFHVIFVALSANYMGTALLLGDLPPQLLHSIAGAEFLDFIYMQGKPSSFPVLALSFVLSTLVYYRLMVREKKETVLEKEDKKPYLNTQLATLTIFFFITTIVLMSLRPMLGVPLGFITIATSAGLSITIEILKLAKKTESPSLEEIVEKIEWKALLFYAGLFALVGGLEASGFIERLAEKIATSLLGDITSGFSILYWVSVLIGAIIEHDAYLLTMFIVIKEASLLHSINPWPYLWALAWGGTIGSNATVAGAPALYVAYALLKREGFSLTTKDFIKATVTYVIVSSIITFPIGLVIWGR